MTYIDYIGFTEREWAERETLQQKDMRVWTATDSRRYAELNARFSGAGPNIQIVFIPERTPAPRILSLPFPAGKRLVLQAQLVPA